jgi:hypothetical protein
MSTWKPKKHAAGTADERRKARNKRKAKKRAQRKRRAK